MLGTIIFFPYYGRVTQSSKKISLYNKNCAHGMYFISKFIEKTQQQWADAMMIQQSLCCLCKIGLFLHFHVLSGAYTGSCCNYWDLIKFALFCHLWYIYIYLLESGMGKGEWLSLYFSFSIRKIRNCTRIKPKLKSNSTSFTLIFFFLAWILKSFMGWGMGF